MNEPPADFGNDAKAMEPAPLFTREDVKPLLIALAYYAEIMGTTAVNYDDGTTAKVAIDYARKKGLLDERRTH